MSPALICSRLFPIQSDAGLSAIFPKALLAVFVILSVFHAQAPASTLSADDYLLQKSDQENVAYAIGWLALLHYRKQTDSTWKSEASQSDFFLDSDGRSSPRKELLASIRASLSPNRKEFACRFPARYEWLVKRLSISNAIDVTRECLDLSSWYSTVAGERISINFASSYLENPSSMFGHTFLKVSGSANELLSPTINYAAKTGAKEGTFSFVRKGLVGGFPGVADQLPFYRRLRTYSENEGRDIWEYELDLSPVEIRLLLLHVWEIKDGVFSYYFIDENCAYQTLALIDVVRPDLGLLNEYRRATIPIDTIKTLKQSGLVTNTKLWPAFPKLVRNHAHQLSEAETNMALRISNGENPDSFVSPDSFVKIPAIRQSAVLQLAYEYLSVQISRDKLDRSTRKAVLNSIIKRRIDLNVPSPLKDKHSSTPPEFGHESSPVSIGRENNDLGSAYTLSWALFQHTLTDRLTGYEPYASITVLHPKVQFHHGDDFRLQSIDWFEIKSTVPGSPLFSSTAWHLLLTSRYKLFNDDYHKVSSLSYSSGRAWSLGKTVISALPGVNMETANAFKHKLAMAGRLSLAVTHQSNFWSSQLRLEGEKFFLGSGLERLNAQLVNSHHISRNISISYTARSSFYPKTDNILGIELKYFFAHNFF